MAASASHLASGKSVGASEVVIRSLNSSVTTFGRPFSRMGAEVGVRMGAIRLSNGDLVLYNPTELDAPTQAKLTELGTVKYIITPNLVHHVFADPYAKAFPQAKFIGPEGIQDKKKDSGIHFAVELKDPAVDYNAQIGWGQEVELVYFPDFAQKEILLFHHPTKTLFAGDMVWNLPANEQYTNIKDASKKPANASHYGLQAAFDKHMAPDGWMGKALSWAADKPTPAFKAGLSKVINQFKPTTVVPEHGDVITADADQKLRSQFEWVKWEQ